MAVADMNDCLQTIGNYDLLQKIAEGGMGTVYRGRNRFTNEIVAVKVVPPHLLSNAVVIKRFEQEYNVARSINHPNIVKALDFGREGDLRYLVMEFVEEHLPIRGAQRPQDIQRQRQIAASRYSVVGHHKWIGKNDDPAFVKGEIRERRAVFVAKVDYRRVQRGRIIITITLIFFAIAFILRRCLCGSL